VSLDRPWALALLVVPVVLLWLRLRAARPREAEASSLLVWAKVSPSDTPSAKPRPPIAAWIEALGAAAVVLGAAGPFLEGTLPRSHVLVIRDTSPSMYTRAENPSGGDRNRLGVACAAQASTGISSQGPGEKDPVPAAIAASATEPVVVITDHRLPGLEDVPGRLRVIGIGKPTFNAGITAASGVPLPDGRWRLFLALEAFGVPGPVEGKLRIGAPEESITVAPGRPLEIVRDVPAGAAEARIEFKGDALAEDDIVAVKAVGGLQVHCFPVDSGTWLVSMVRAMAAAGADVQGGPGGWESSRPGIRIWSESKHLYVRTLKGDEGAVVNGTNVSLTTHALARDVRVDPSSTLGRRIASEEQRGVPVMVGLDGALVSVEEDMDGFTDGKKTTVVNVGFEPGGTWVERDPSFVVFAKNLVDYAAGGPARIEATGVLSSAETREAAEGETFGDIRAAFEEARRPDPAARASWAFALLLAGAVLLGAAWIALR
jgi:hypothetical protein